ncbi:MAG: hypothetical protein J1E04_03995 [Alistipes sp.]|nr:hypothetical protein [Alistipes sp.]
MDLTPVLVVGFIVLSIYKVIELCVCRRERVMLIEKLDREGLAEFIRNGGIPQNMLRPYGGSNRHFGIMHLAAAMLGLGTGLVFTFSVLAGFFDFDHFPYYGRELCSGGFILLFTGLALVISFIVEYKLTARKKEE